MPMDCFHYNYNEPSSAFLAAGRPSSVTAVAVDTWTLRRVCLTIVPPASVSTDASRC
jgi:hypothetical protein